MNMIGYCIVCGYWVIGMILMIYWWITEYKQDYEKTKATGECEESMVILYWVFTPIIWPLVICAKYIIHKEKNKFVEK